MVKQPLSLSLDRSRVASSAPAIASNHFCVEGWTAVATRTGVALADLARLARRATEGAQYVDFESFDDDYHESWDIDSAMHPQTLVVYAQDGALPESRRVRRPGPRCTRR